MPISRFIVKGPLPIFSVQYRSSVVSQMASIYFIKSHSLCDERVKRVKPQAQGSLQS